MVVVIDTDREVAGIFSAILHGEGYQACVCPADRATHEQIGQLHPEVVIVDLHYIRPQATLGLLEQLRRTPATARVPLVVTSTSEQLLAQHAAQLDDLGCATLAKPFLIERLLDQLDTAQSRAANAHRAN
jgi:DNA-binding response OmpR family regulator